MTTLILLAAGRGSRLKGLTAEVPKCLNNYQGKSLLQHILDTASRFEEQITNKVIVSGYRSELLAKLGYEVLENTDWNSSGPFGSLTCAQRYLDTTDCIVSYTDIVYGEEFLQSCLSSKANIFLPSNSNYRQSWSRREVRILDDLERFVCLDNKLIEIGSRPKSFSEIQGQFAGIFKTSPEGWRSILEVTRDVDSKKMDMTSVFSLAIKNGVCIQCEQVLSNWKEFDLPSDFH